MRPRMNGPLYCGHCGRKYKSWQAGVTHNGREHPDCQPDLRPQEALPTWDVSFDIPEGVTPCSLAEAVAESDSLQGVLEAIDWPEDPRAHLRIRALVHSAGYYHALPSPEAWDREAAAQRGWM